MVTVEIGTDNAAYRDDGTLDIGEVAATLRHVADRLERGDWHPGHTRSILDVNGNRVGGYKVHEH